MNGTRNDKPNWSSTTAILARLDKQGIGPPPPFPPMKTYGIDLCATRHIEVSASTIEGAEKRARRDALDALRGTGFTLEETGDIEEVESE